MLFGNKNSKVIDEVLFSRQFNESNKPLFDEIDGDVKDLDITFKVGKGYEVRFHGKEENKPDVKVEDGVLKIKQSRRPKNHHIIIEINVSSSNYGLIITTPKDIPVDKVSINSASGDLSFDETIAQDVKLSLASGDLHLKQASFENAMIDLVSGDAKLENVEATNLKINSASGDINLNECNIVSLASLSAASGDLTVAATGFRTYELQTMSGDCRLFNKEASDSILEQGKGQEPILKMSAASGDCIVRK